MVTFVHTINGGRKVPPTEFIMSLGGSLLELFQTNHEKMKMDHDFINFNLLTVMSASNGPLMQMRR